MARVVGNALNSLVVPSEASNNNLRKYIWYGSLSEQKKAGEELFRFFLQNKVYIEGFASDNKELIGEEKYHKRIIDIQDLKKEEAVVFIEKEYERTHYEVFQMAYQVNPLLQNGQVVIWGTGDNGNAAYELMVKAGVRVKYYLDSNKTMQGGKLNGIPVYGLEKLEEIDNSEILVEAYDRYFEMDKTVRERHPHITRRFYCDIHSLLVLYREQEEVLLHLNANRFELLKLYGKRVMVYGSEKGAVEFSDYLELLDFNVVACLSDDDSQSSSIGNGRPIVPVEEVLYEDNYVIWVQDNEAERAKRCLRELGICFDLDVIIPRKLQTILDVNLGYTYFYEGYYSGMTIYGQERKKNYKIVALGGSTTDGTWETIKSWPQFLYEKLNRKDIIIYNAGVSGYVSGQELIRLIRDILPLKPDMVIVYDGANDSGGNVVFPEEPYAFNYAKAVYEFGAKHMEDSYMKKENGKYLVNYGLKSQKGRFGNWLSNIESMYALCSSRNIAFYSFMQPVLLSKGSYNKAEQELYEKYEGDYSFMAGFRGAMKKYGIEASHPYICDLSHIFDEVEDVYFDACHVWEKGNKIIASEIYKRISGEMNVWKKSYL